MNPILRRMTLRRNEKQRRVPAGETAAAPPEGVSALQSRAVAWVCLVSVFLLTVYYFAAEGMGVVLGVLLVEGMVAAGWVTAAGGLGWFLLRWMGVRSNRAVMVATSAGLGLGVFGLVGLGLGLVGMLNWWTTMGMGVVGVVLGGMEVVRRGRARPLIAEATTPMESWMEWLGEPARYEWLWLLGAVPAGMAVVAAALLPGAAWRPDDPHPYDSLSYHLQVPREWMELGRIAPLEHNVFSYFPFGMEMQFLLAMQLRGGPWEGMYVAQLISLAMGVLMVVGVYGVGRIVGEGSGPERLNAGEEVRSASRFGAHLGAVVVANVPWVIMLATVTFVESGLMLYTVLAAGWVLSGVGRADGAWKNFVIGGVFAGLACGMKYTAVPMLLLALPGAVVLGEGLRWSLKRPRRRGDEGLCGETGSQELKDAVKGGVIFGVVGMIVVSPWLMRNWAWTGNPVFPLAMKQLGQAHFTDEQVERWERAHRPPPGREGVRGRVGALWSEVAVHWQYGSAYFVEGRVPVNLLWPLAVVGLVVGLSSAGLDPAGKRGVMVLGLLLLMMLMVWVGFTHLISRFFVMAIPVAGVLFGAVAWGGRGDGADGHPRPSIGLVAGIVVAVVMSVVTVRHLHHRLVYFADLGREGLFGIVDLSIMIPEELERMYDERSVVALVGDAGAFFYQIPMDRLMYRTVFDVDPFADDFIEAWLGEAPAVGRGDLLLVIHPMEVERLHRTYYRIPVLPETYPGPRNRPFVVRR
jgi:hypothetical protein